MTGPRGERGAGRLGGSQSRRTREVLGIAAGLLMLAGVGGAGAETNPSVLAGSCANCHGPNGVSPGDIPSIAGEPYAVLKAQLEAFRAGEPADATVMPRLMRAYSDAEIDALARWFSEVSQ